MTALDYPLWLRAAQCFDVLFLSLAGQGGLEVLSTGIEFVEDDTHIGIGHGDGRKTIFTFARKQESKERQ